MNVTSDEPSDLRVGDTLRVGDGPFAGYRGRIAAVDRERRTVGVIVVFFGRETPLDLDVLQVERET